MIEKIGFDDISVKKSVDTGVRVRVSRLRSFLTHAPFIYFAFRQGWTSEAVDRMMLIVLVF